VTGRPLRAAARVLNEPDARADPAKVLRAVRRCACFIDEHERDFVERLTLSRRVSPDDHERLIALLERVVGAKKAPRRDQPPWKRDDATWFECQPRRSYRLRRAFPGEVTDRAPEGSRWHVVVRRERLWLHFFTDRDFPDEEETARALFDAIGARHAEGGVAGSYVYLDDDFVRRLADGPKGPRLAWSKPTPHDGGAA
jgi:hypothetical protein